MPGYPYDYVTTNKEQNMGDPGPENKAVSNPVFNEFTLREAIVGVWGEHGAHIDVYDHMLGLCNKPDEHTVRGEVLLRALSLTEGDRNQAYGDPKPNLTTLALLWTAWLKGRGLMSQDEDDLDAADAAAMMVLTKLSRLTVNDQHGDSWTDAAAYAAIGYEVAGASE